jgi:hypothetical protein
MPGMQGRSITGTSCEKIESTPKNNAVAYIGGAHRTQIRLHLTHTSDTIVLFCETSLLFSLVCRTINVEREKSAVKSHSRLTVL